MSTNAYPRGIYREGTMESGATYAYVTDGTMTFSMSEGDYRMRGYTPAYDALPTKEQYIENGGKHA